MRVNEAPSVSTHKKVVKQQTGTPLDHLTTAIHIMESVIHKGFGLRERGNRLHSLLPLQTQNNQQKNYCLNTIII
jgi:hypothetical protein